MNPEVPKTQSEMVNDLMTDSFNAHLEEEKSEEETEEQEETEAQQEQE